VPPISVIGQPGAEADGRPTSALVRNPNTTTHAPGVVRYVPMIENGMVIGWDANNDGRIDVSADQRQDTSKYTQPVLGQTLGSALLRGRDLRAARDVAFNRGIDDDYSAQLQTRVINMADLARIDRGWARVLPKGLDPKQVYASAEGALSASAGNPSARPDIVFFVVDRASGTLVPLSDEYTRQHGPASSYAGPAALGQHPLPVVPGAPAP
jgi:hypothetical protein